MKRKTGSVYPMASQSCATLKHHGTEELPNVTSDTHRNQPSATPNHHGREGRTSHEIAPKNSLTSLLKPCKTSQRLAKYVPDICQTYTSTDTFQALIGNSCNKVPKASRDRTRNAERPPNYLSSETLEKQHFSLTFVAYCYCCCCSFLNLTSGYTQRLRHANAAGP